MWNEAPGCSFLIDCAGNVLKIELGKRSILFTGDIQRDGQLAMLTNRLPIQADVLKFPHHGYRNMNPDSLALMNPTLMALASSCNTPEGAKQLKNNKILHLGR